MDEAIETKVDIGMEIVKCMSLLFFYLCITV